MYLTAAVAALGLAVYLSSYGPLFQAGADFFTPTLLDLGVVASLLAALIAGAGLVPRQKTAPALVAVLSVLGFLLVLAIVLTTPQGVKIEWGLYLIIGFSVVQAIVAVAVLLFDAGVITPPAPRPRYEQQQQYGQYGGPGPYYGQPQQPGPPHQSRSTSSGLAIPGRTAVATPVVRRRRILGGPAERPSDAAHGFPDLRSAAVEQQCADDNSGCSGKSAVVFHAVRAIADDAGPVSRRRLPRSPARRRRSLSRACVKFARVS